MKSVMFAKMRMPFVEEGSACVAMVTLHRTQSAVCQSLPPATKLRQGNVFTGVCQEFCPQGGGVSIPACTTGHMTRGSLSGGSLSGGLCPGVSVQVVSVQ